MDQPVMTCGAALMAGLKAYGVDTVFGIPGVHTLEIYRGIAQVGLRHVVVRHEQGAGFMADGYARISGRPGVCVLITGPGVTNAATAIAEAYAESSPMLVISSVNARGDLGMGRGELHELPSQQAVTAGLTGMSATALRTDEVPELLARAFALFATGRPRPAHIAVPIDVLAEPAGFTPEARALPAPAAPDHAAVARAAALLAKAERPVILAGGGAQASAALLLRLAERVGAAVVTTRGGKGVLPETHGLSLGATLRLPGTRAVLAGADVVLAVGTEISQTDHWMAPRLALGGKLIRLDIDAAALVRDYPAAVALHGDAGAGLAALLDELVPARNAPSGYGDGAALAARRTENLAVLTPKQRRHAKALGALRKGLPATGFVAADSTQLAYTGNPVFPCAGPRSWFFPVGYGTLGFALPAAIGAKLAAPERPGAVIIGDGGLLFTVQELATAVDYKVPLAVIVWNNDAYGQIKDDMGARGFPTIGVDLRNPDFVALARAFGCHALRPGSLDELAGAVAAADARDVPTVIDLREDLAFLD